MRLLGRHSRPLRFHKKPEWVLDSKEAQRHPLLWTRGLVPACIYDRDDDVDEALCTDAGQRDPPHLNLDTVMAADCAIFATDGAGASREVPASVARVGAAAVAIGFTQGLPTALAIQPLACPGRQTIPRAEAWAYIVMAKKHGHSRLSAHGASCFRCLVRRRRSS